MDGIEGKEMSSLEFMAMSWLKFEKKCQCVLTGRTPRYNGLPDILGVTPARYLLEIEIKRSVSDFRADSKKIHIACRNTIGPQRELLPSRWPRQFWYCVPVELVAKVEPLVPEWAGLLRGPRDNEPQGLWCVKKAPLNNEASKLTAKECSRLMHVMCNQIYATAIQLEGWKYGQESDWGIEYRI